MVPLTGQIFFFPPLSHFEVDFDINQCSHSQASLKTDQPTSNINNQYFPTSGVAEN